MLKTRNISHSSLETLLEIELLIVVNFTMETCSWLLGKIVVPVYKRCFCEDAFDSCVNSERLIWVC